MDLPGGVHALGRGDGSERIAAGQVDDGQTVDVTRGIRRHGHEVVGRTDLVLEDLELGAGAGHTHRQIHVIGPGSVDDVRR